MDEKEQERVATEITVEQLSLRIAQQIKTITELRRSGCDTAEALATLAALTNEHRQRVAHCAKVLRERNPDEEPPSRSKGAKNSQ